MYEKLHTYQDVMNQLGLSRSSVKRRIADGTLPEAPTNKASSFEICPDRSGVFS